MPIVNLRIDLLYVRRSANRRLISIGEYFLQTTLNLRLNLAYHDWRLMSKFALLANKAWGLWLPKTLNRVASLFCRRYLEAESFATATSTTVVNILRNRKTILDSFTVFHDSYFTKIFGDVIARIDCRPFNTNFPNCRSNNRVCGWCVLNKTSTSIKSLSLKSTESSHRFQHPLPLPR